MKNYFKIFVTLFIIAFAANVSLAQTPTYTLTAKNFQLIGSENALVWDIVLVHTDANQFEYAGGQYFFNFNNAAANGGTLSYAFAQAGSSADSSSFAANMRPRNPQISGTQLRLAANSLPGAGNGTIIPQGVNWLVCKMRLATTAAIFATVNLDLQWRNAPTANPVTKLNAYIGTTNTEITTTNTHSVDCDPLICNPLPVDLAAFTASVNRNNVVLNWSTTSELNNQGFDIERRAIGSTDWSRVGNVAGNGTTSEQRSYSYNDRVSTGKYNYRLKQMDINGNFTYHQLPTEVEVGVPNAYNLSQNYPNPFNPSTKIDYDLPYDGRVSIVLYDISGREVANLVNEVKTAGYYSISFNAANLASGMYFYRINAEGNSNNFVQTKKMVLVK